MFTGKLLQLQQNLKNLPGIGDKTARRLALFLVSQDKDKALRLAGAIEEAVSAYRLCRQCRMLTETEICHICNDSERNDSQLCIVQNSGDIDLIESTREYHGKYFVLGHLLSPIDGIGPEQIHLKDLLALIQKTDFNEIIFAISPSAEGETTIHFIAEHLQQKELKLTRLSTGIPYGSDMEYTGTMTLTNALKRRYPV